MFLVSRCPIHISPPLKYLFLIPQSTAHINVHKVHKVHFLPLLATALKESHDDDDEQHDPDQPISNIGRGGSVSPSRSSPHNARVRGGTGSQPTPPVTRSSGNTSNLNGTFAKKFSLGSSFGGDRVGFGSPSMTMEVDEMDAAEVNLLSQMKRYGISSNKNLTICY